MEDFKGKFQLFDTRGARSQEPDERHAGELDKLQRLKHGCLCRCCGSYFMFLILYWAARFYTFSCYDEYFKIQVLTLHNISLPITEKIKRETGVYDECNLEGSEMSRFLKHHLRSGVVEIAEHAAASAKDAANWSTPHARRLLGAECHPTFAQVLNGACVSLTDRSLRPTFSPKYFYGFVPCPAPFVCQANNFLETVAHFWAVIVIVLWAVVFVALVFFFHISISRKEKEVVEGTYKPVATYDPSYNDQAATRTARRGFCGAPCGTRLNRAAV